MWRHEGPRAFYKGLTPFCTNIVLKNAVRFRFNEFYRSLFRRKDGKAVLIVTPFEVIKTRLQQQKGTDPSRLVPTMFRQGWNQLFLFGTYDTLKQAVLGLD
eukprot:gene33474-18011_t